MEARQNESNLLPLSLWREGGDVTASDTEYLHRGMNLHLHSSCVAALWEVRAPATVRPRSQTDFVPGRSPSSTLGGHRRLSEASFWYYQKESFSGSFLATEVRSTAQHRRQVRISAWAVVHSHLTTYDDPLHKSISLRHPSTAQVLQCLQRLPLRLLQHHLRASCPASRQSRAGQVSVLAWFSVLAGFGGGVVVGGRDGDGGAWGGGGGEW